MEGYLYILRSIKNSSYYVGSTINVDNRLAEHNQGRVKATKYLVPLELVFIEKFGTIKEARQAEYKLKKKKSRLIIEKIVAEGNIRFI